MEDFVGEKEWKKIKFQNRNCCNRYFGGLGLVKKVGKKLYLDSFLCSLDSYLPHWRGI